ncbi:hypothetical protein CROQUDRAFT_92081 [Cronartium quercuum f. sp. fusiforme G11]|uniref:Uncharacterized protein n=1 Tax=Cronartium quercuum f. sp. fusiforme G11 TaxID=708437 RepID=A0A9P6NJ48_9BASI|nr:hypothetical protein CROQUDRAFT_92081 [Cronartium quercuum f. sp. fusiforme G11]
MGVGGIVTQTGRSAIQFAIRVICIRCIDCYRRCTDCGVVVVVIKGLENGGVKNSF